MFVAPLFLSKYFQMYGDIHEGGINIYKGLRIVTKGYEYFVKLYK